MTKTDKGVDVCKHHGLPRENGAFCRECRAELEASHDYIKGLFNRVLGSTND